MSHPVSKIDVTAVTGSFPMAHCEVDASGCYIVGGGSTIARGPNPAKAWHNAANEVRKFLEDVMS